MADANKINEKPNLKRKVPARAAQHRKWSEGEVNDIIHYLLVHRNLEKPTAQIYYNKLIAETNIDASWNSIRHKVRNLKIGWQKADAFTKSTGAGVDEGDEVTTIRAKVLRMCPQYEKLEEIFSGNKEMEVLVLESGEFNPTTSMLQCEDASNFLKFK